MSNFYNNLSNMLYLPILVYPMNLFIQILLSDGLLCNLLDFETQLRKETVTPAEALETAIAMENGAQNQQKVNQKWINIILLIQLLETIKEIATQSSTNIEKTTITTRMSSIEIAIQISVEAVDNSLSLIFSIKICRILKRQLSKKWKMYFFFRKSFWGMKCFW